MGMGVHLYQITCWQGSSGLWYVNDIKNLSGRSAKWYTPMRILGLSVEEYIDLLKTFHAEGISYCMPSDYLYFYFTKEKGAKAFCSYVNKKAKCINYCCA